jgi:tripartite-type tricarboxylate transporter receptor subunit TctC
MIGGVSGKKLKLAGITMKLPRRKFLHFATVAAAFPSLIGNASASDYPVRPVRIVVSFPPGGAPDIIARLIGQWLSERLDQQFLVDNRPGAAGNIGTEIVAKAPPDGYTLLIAVSTTAVNAALYTNLNFNFSRDIAPVASIGGTAFVMAFNPSFPLYPQKRTLMTETGISAKCQKRKSLELDQWN